MRKPDMISNGYHEHQQDMDKVCVEHTQGMIIKDLLLDEDKWEKKTQKMRDDQIG
jgi:hypothetical protein